jgi:hypothetical protein
MAAVSAEGSNRPGLDPTFELLVEPFDCVGGTRALPLADRQPGEGEQPVTGLLEAVGYRFAFEPPFADEGTSAVFANSIGPRIISGDASRAIFQHS